MKKLKKVLPRRKRSNEQPVGRITNETVAEHREQILAGGRRYKYPMQYAKNRLVINTLLITFAALVLVAGFVWWQLYVVQSTATFFYKLTRVVPVPVARIDGSFVRYSDYLRRFRSYEHYLTQYEQIKPGSENGKKQLDYYKRRTIDHAEMIAYAMKVAREKGITVTDEEVSAVIERDKSAQNGKISQEAYDTSARLYFNWEPDEYRFDTKQKLLQQKVAYEVDTLAKRKKVRAEELLKKPDVKFADIAPQLDALGGAKTQVGVSGLINHTSSFGGLSLEANKLDVGQISPAIKSTVGDGYYFVRLLEKNTTQVNYEFVRIPLTEFTTRVDELKKQQNVHEYINVPKQ